MSLILVQVMSKVRVGQLLSTSSTDIRIVRVESASEADSIFLSLCLGQKVDRVMYNGDEWHTQHRTAIFS